MAITDLLLLWLLYITNHIQVQALFFFTPPEKRKLLRNKIFSTIKIGTKANDSHTTFLGPQKPAHSQSLYIFYSKTSRYSGARESGHIDVGTY